MYTVLSYIRPFEGNLKADVAPGENEFDTPALKESESTPFRRFQWPPPCLGKHV